MYFKIASKAHWFLIFWCYDGLTSLSDAPQTRWCDSIASRLRQRQVCVQDVLRSGLASSHYRPSLCQHKYNYK